MGKHSSYYKHKRAAEVFEHSSQLWFSPKALKARPSFWKARLFSDKYSDEFFLPRARQEFLKIWSVKSRAELNRASNICFQIRNLWPPVFHVFLFTLSLLFFWNIALLSQNLGIFKWVATVQKQSPGGVLQKRYS